MELEEIKEMYGTEIRIFLAITQIAFMLWAVWMLWQVDQYRNGFDAGKLSMASCAPIWRP